MTAHPVIRDERPGDAAAIHTLTAEAFAPMPYSDGTEAPIVDALRAEGDLTLSLVAVAGEDGIVGHVAFSPVRIDGRHGGWYGLGPLSVRPGHQRRGIGSRLVRDGLTRLRGMGAKGCALIGDPAYYGRFGFEGDRGLAYRGIAPAYVQQRALDGGTVSGTLAFASAFEKAGGD